MCAPCALPYCNFLCKLSFLILDNSLGEEVIINQVGSNGIYVGKIDFNFTNDIKSSDISIVEV